MKIRILLTLIAVLVAPLATAGDIAGFWRHAEEPGWIEIQVEEGVGTGKVVRNDVYPERVGRELLKGLSMDESGEGLWSGQVFVERLGEYKDVKVSSDKADQLQFKVKVGFISRTVNWIRVEEVPAN